MNNQEHSRPTRHVLMVYDQDSTFVRRDVRILEREYIVHNHHFNSKPKWKTPLAFAKLFFRILFNRKYKTVVTQSAGYLSLVPAFFGMLGMLKCAIVVIGTDGAKLPEINYGHFIRKPLAWATCKSLAWAQLILPVHKSLEQNEYTYAPLQYRMQGFRSFCPNIKTPVREVVNGYDHKKFVISTPWNERPKTYLTVAAHLSHVSFRRKGLDLIFEFAQANPQVDITVVSIIPADISVPPNVEMVTTVPQKDLVDFYNQHKYYLQLSMFEGFPNALCEAMLCGCVPVGSAVAAIPEIIENDGYILAEKNLEQLQEVHADIDGSALNPRLRIEQNFPIERRTSEFIDAINSL